MRTFTFFSPEVIQYMEANGYTKSHVDEMSGSMYFRNDKNEVVFWQDKIECRPLVRKLPVRNSDMTSFKGFDGKDIPNLMMILHLMKAVDLNEVKAKVTGMPMIKEGFWKGLRETANA